MILLQILFWLVMLYGLVAIVLRFIPVVQEVPGTDTDRFGRPVMQKVKQSIKLPFAYVAFIVGLIFVVILSLIIKVDAQNVGVVTTPNGVQSVPLHTGWHVLAPWNDVHFMDKTVWVYTCANSTTEGAKPNADAIWAPTKDGIKIGFDVSVSWRIMGDEAPWIYQNVTENDGGNSGRYLWLEENVIRPKLKSAMALTVSGYTPIEAYSTKRQDIQNEILRRITDECKQYKLQIDNVDVREVYYNKDYELAINAKKLAEQEVLRLVEVTRQKDELLLQATIEKNISIQKAEGEAKALQIKGASLASNPKIIDLEWIAAWKAGGSQVPQYISNGTSGGGSMFMLDLKKKE
jgi:regulator of protease activity HflC (stomatin/prohibitin superfamily)